MAERPSIPKRRRRLFCVLSMYRVSDGNDADFWRRGTLVWCLLEGAEFRRVRERHVKSDAIIVA